MKISVLLFIIIALFQTGRTHAQNFNISMGGTVNTCSGNFYDSGGPTGTYQNNESYIMTLRSNSALNPSLRVVFSSFNIVDGDTLFIYDGPTTLSPLLGKHNNDFNPLTLLNNSVQSSIYNTNGELTFRFTSNSANTTAGWSGQISCTHSCQEIVPALNPVSTFPNPAGDIILVCPYDSVRFAALADASVFPQNDILYHQDSLNCIFNWNFGDGTQGTGIRTWHKFDSSGTFTVILNIEDSSGCISTHPFSMDVVVINPPHFHSNLQPQYCLDGSTFTLNAGLQGSASVQIIPGGSINLSSQPPIFDSAVFIPDGPYCASPCLDVPITYTDFTPGAVISSAADIKSICINAEHSFTGDLGFWLKCPNGQEIMLDANTHSGGAFLGIPMGGANHHSYDGTDQCDPAQNPSGIGWNYCWSEIYPQSGTLNTLDMMGGTIDSTHIQAHTGYITSEQGFSGLVGCPLNGTWTMKVCDDYGADNGYLFGWSIGFSASLDTIINSNIESIHWAGPNIISNQDSVITIFPTEGLSTYTVTVYDESGCSFDTTITIGFFSTFPVGLTDTTVCLDATVYLDAGEGYDTYHWNNGANSQVTSFYAYTTGVFPFSVTVTAGSCSGADTMLVTIVDCSYVPQYDWYGLETWPNPANDQYLVQYPGSDKGIITLSDASGRIVKTSSLEPGVSNCLDLSGIGAGLYIARIEAGDRLALRKVLISR